MVATAITSRQETTSRRFKKLITTARSDALRLGLHSADFGPNFAPIKSGLIRWRSINLPPAKSTAQAADFLAAGFPEAMTKSNPSTGDNSREQKKYPQKPNMRCRPKNATTILIAT
jgi:hypothetical protein